MIRTADGAELRKHASERPEDRVLTLLRQLAHLLPAQGPIGVFIHHNTLHAFQHLPFETAVCEAAKTFGTEPYMLESAYRNAIRKGRILEEDIAAILEAEPDLEIWTGGLRRRELRRSMLLPGVREFHAETIDWELSECGMQDRFRSDLASLASEALSAEKPAELFQFCLERMPLELKNEPSCNPARPRDGVLRAIGVDIDDVVRPLLIKLSSVFLDQGLAYWPMPHRDQGFWSASLQILGQSFGGGSVGLRRLPEYMKICNSLGAVEAVVQLLEILGVDEAEWARVLEAELLALPGWAGLMYQLEMDPTLAPNEKVRASLMDFVAVRLLLTVAATASVADETQNWRVGRATSHDAASVRLARAASFFDAAQLVGLSSQVMSRLQASELEQLIEEIDRFGNWERRRVLHLAYERRHERQILLPLGKHRERSSTDGVCPVVGRPAAQAIFCIDEREESIRRHLEETDFEIETFGAAGFFGVAVNYKGIDDAHGVALCPVVVKPRHAVEERPKTGEQARFGRRLSMRRLWARSVRHWFVASRSLVRGSVGTSVLGLFQLVPLAGRVLSPRHYSQLLNWLDDSMLPGPSTELAFEHEKAKTSHADEGLLQGFTVAEKIDRVASMLGAAGLKKDMARLVFVLGHGSTSLNNPHESAHDCGACGGRRGGPNGRLFAAMANHREVRSGLVARGVVIPEDTWFIGGYHDTCSDGLDLYDLSAVPETHAADLARVHKSLDRARSLSAHERARRFEAAAWGIDANGGRQHVEERAQHLAEPRPEYGHCTNAVCIVGRRSTTRGLFFDRRAFLVSYDASQDAENQSLAALLGAVIPVCAGINLEYYFSFVDNEGYGCGTKLPHNVTGLVGVMNGYESDLRTGLPWQMVEIHEPVRILFVVETSTERLLATIEKNPLLWEFLSKRWIRLAAMDPEGGPILAYRDGKWEAVEGDDEDLPQAHSSAEWYAGKREHLPVAYISKRVEALGQA